MNTFNAFLEHELQNLPNGTQNNPPGPLHRQFHANLIPCKLTHMGKASATPPQHPHKKTHTQRASSTQNETSSVPVAETTNTAPAQTCVPCRQKNAKEYLEGTSAGVMAFYAPEQQSEAIEEALAPSSHCENPTTKNTAIEDAETVERLVEWREDAPYG